MAQFKAGDRVVKNPATWTPSDFDAWCAGEGVGVVVEIVGDPGDGSLGDLDVEWPTGRCYQRSEEVLPARTAD